MSRPAPGVPPIEHEEHPSKGRYLAKLDGAAAEITYSRAGESMIIIDPTEVPDAMRGRSVGRALVRRAVEDARAVPSSRSVPSPKRSLRAIPTGTMC